MACIIWIDQPLNDAKLDISGAEYCRFAQKITVPNKTICKAGFLFKREYSPTGTLYARIRKVSDDSIIETSVDTVDVSTVPTSDTWYYFTFNSLVNEEVRIGIEYTGGDTVNHILGRIKVSDVCLGCGSYDYPCGFNWTDYGTHDLAIKIYEEEIVGEDHFKTVTEVLGLVDSYTRTAAFHKTTTELLGLVDSYDKNKCRPLPIIVAAKRLINKPLIS